VHRIRTDGALPPLHLVHRIRTDGALPPLHLLSSWVVKRTNLLEPPRLPKPTRCVPPQPHLSCNFLPVIMKFVDNRCIFSHCVQFAALWTDLVFISPQSISGSAHCEVRISVRREHCQLPAAVAQSTPHYCSVWSTASCLLQWHRALHFTVLCGAG